MQQFCKMLLQQHQAVSSPTPVFALVHVNAPSGADVAAASLKATGPLPISQHHPLYTFSKVYK